MISVSSERFRLKSDQIAFKIFEDDVVIINLATSIYYTIGGVGPTVWQMLEAGWSVDEISDAIAGRFDRPVTTVRGDVEKLVADLTGQGLILSDPSLSTGDDLEITWTLQDYAPIVLECFSDMQDVLALDPPHPEIAPPSTASTE